MPKSVTIAIPTHNRARTLSETLDSLKLIAIPEDIAVECVVIDNASTDDTPRVVEAAANPSPPFPIRRVLEPRQGSSFARNRAVDEARGDFIFFLDDDATADREWLRAMLSALGDPWPRRCLRDGVAAMEHASAAMARARGYG